MPAAHTIEPGDDRMLAPLGLLEEEETAYRVLLREGPETAAAIGSVLALPAKSVASTLRLLERKGLVSVIPGRPTRFAAVAPDIALEVLLVAKQQELERVRARSAELVEEFRARAAKGGSKEFVEIVRGREAIFQAFQNIQLAAHEEIRIFDRPPYAHRESQAIVNPFELERLANGIAYRVIYDRSALDHPSQFEVLDQHVEAGEEARIISQLPMKLVVADRFVAMVPLYANGDGPTLLRNEEALVVHPGALLDCLVQTFEILWERARPFRLQAAAEDDGVSQQDRRIIELMSSGLKDEAIARHLGMGTRSVRRRIAAMMESLGAETRFQAGIEAGRAGWV